jgi:3-keto-disaccharide hydrolase
MRVFTISAALFAFLACSLNAIAAADDFNGRWDLIVHNNPNCTVTCAWWLEVTAAGTPEMKATFVGFPDGSLHQLPDLTIRDGVLHFAWDHPASTRGRESAPTGAGSAPAPAHQHMDYEAQYVNGKLEGKVSGAKNLTFTGERAPAINEHDDGTWIKEKPIVLFNGKDLTGWTGIRTENAEGWTVENGILTSRGHADDLVTKEKYWNFELHAEYNLEERSNSGIGLRGRYEVQIASDFGRPPGMHGTGALYTRILPRVNASKPAGEWQTYDIRLVGMEVTAILNGVKLYERGVIDGLTGIAYDPYEGKPGSLELQGDHGAVKFRNVVLTPLTKKAK